MGGTSCMMFSKETGARTCPGAFGLSTRIKDAGIAIRHSQGRILFYTAGSGNGLEGGEGRGYAHTKGS